MLKKRSEGEREAAHDADYRIGNAKAISKKSIANFLNKINEIQPENLVTAGLNEKPDVTF